MLSTKDKAVPLFPVAKATASTNNLQVKSYRTSAPVSIAKLQIGTLLLALQAPLNLKQQENGWQLFGVMLRQYVDLKYVRAE